MNTFSKTELKRIYQALIIAIDSEWEFIGCHTTKLESQGGHMIKTVPADFKSTVNKSRRSITAFRRLATKIQKGAK